MSTIKPAMLSFLFYRILSVVFVWSKITGFREHFHVVIIFGSIVRSSLIFFLESEKESGRDLVVSLRI